MLKFLIWRKFLKENWRVMADTRKHYLHALYELWEAQCCGSFRPSCNAPIDHLSEHSNITGRTQRKRIKSYPSSVGDESKETQIRPSTCWRQIQRQLLRISAASKHFESRPISELNKHTTIPFIPTIPTENIRKPLVSGYMEREQWH